jgi:glycosyltransferase involved in cell wall biosynthesis
MKKLLLLTGEISPYNVSVYNEIGKSFGLTVAFYSKDKSKQDCKFEKIKLEPRKVGPFTLIKGMARLCKGYDVVSVIPDLHVLSFWKLPFLHRKYKTVTWSIGFRCSYVHPYVVTRKHNILDWVFLQVLKHSDANIFYMEKSREFWKNSSLDMSRVFVAPNTTDVVPIDILPENKKTLLFVGTLYRGKGLDKLLSSVKEVVDKGYNNLSLIIVGDGECKSELESYVMQNNLTNNVEFTGAIFDEKVLATYFAKALLCISPTQGGLSCPKSMGYGVPFVTRKDAITGGEIYHITPDVNGIMYDNDEDLASIIEDACKNPDKYIQMGLAAKEYYDNHATIKHMAKGAMDAYKCALGI